MGKQTYDNYYRAYYQKNKKRICRKNREYKKKYNHEYYLKMKEERDNYNKMIAEGVKLPENPRPIEKIEL